MRTLSKIEELARRVADDALGPDNEISFHNRVEALKVLTPYYVALQKASSAQDEDDDAGTMRELAKTMREHNGPATLRSDR
jgi:hypothetical protein